MKIELTYPRPSRQKRFADGAARIMRWPLLFAAYICPILNIATGGKAWCLVVLWALWMAWSLILSPSLVEYNRTSQFIKMVAEACVMLLIIGVFLAPGWAAEVVPIVCFSGLAVGAALFYTDLERQKQNMMPLLLLAAAALAVSAVGLAVIRDESRWALTVMGAFALAFLASAALVLGPEFLREVKKRFSTK